MAVSVWHFLVHLPHRTGIGEGLEDLCENRAWKNSSTLSWMEKPYRFDVTMQKSDGMHAFNGFEDLRADPQRGGHGEGALGLVAPQLGQILPLQRHDDVVEFLIPAAPDEPANMLPSCEDTNQETSPVKSISQSAKKSYIKLKMIHLKRLPTTQQAHSVPYR